jgi:uncharacterized protein
VKYLIDVDALLAAAWETHANHARVDRWLEGKELATCPVTEIGFLRISTHPKALNSDMASARLLLKEFLAKNKVEFVPADIGALQANATKSSSVTDVYLAELAASKGMKLATLDSAISHRAVEILG